MYLQLAEGEARVAIFSDEHLPDFFSRRFSREEPTIVMAFRQCFFKTMVSFGLVRYCMLRGKPFWFSSLGQQVHFGIF